MSSLDLSLHNYTTKELLELFDFEDNIPHHKSSIEDVCMKKINTINDNDNISKSKKEKVTGFFEKVKAHLVETFFKKPESPLPENNKPQEQKYDPNTNKIPVSNDVQLITPVQYIPGKVNPIRQQTLTTTYSFNTKFRKITLQPQVIIILFKCQIL